MGYWGPGSDEGDGPLDLMAALFDEVDANTSPPARHGRRKHVMWIDRMTRGAKGWDADATASAAHMLTNPPSPPGGTVNMLNVAGCTIIFIRYGHGQLLTALVLRLVEVVLEMELLPERLDGWKAGRKTRVLAELRSVRNQLRTIRLQKQRRGIVHKASTYGRRTDTTHYSR